MPVAPVATNTCPHQTGSKEDFLPSHHLRTVATGAENPSIPQTYSWVPGKGPSMFLNSRTVTTRSQASSLLEPSLHDLAFSILPPMPRSSKAAGTKATSLVPSVLNPQDLVNVSPASYTSRSVDASITSPDTIARVLNDPGNTSSIAHRLQVTATKAQSLVPLALVPWNLWRVSLWSHNSMKVSHHATIPIPTALAS